MILIAENFHTQRKTCPNTTLPTQYPTWITLGSKVCLHSEKPVTKPPEPWIGQTYNLFISKMKVTIKKDNGSKVLLIALWNVLHICRQHDHSLCCSDIYQYIWLCLAYISAKNNKYNNPVNNVLVYSAPKINMKQSAHFCQLTTLYNI